MVIDFKRSSAYRKTGRTIAADFLEDFSRRFNKLEYVFKSRGSGSCSASTAVYHVSAMKDFVFESGGFHAVELLSEYEKCCAIGDDCSCEQLEKRIVSELKIFRECWISLIS